MAKGFINVIFHLAVGVGVDGAEEVAAASQGGGSREAQHGKDEDSARLHGVGWIVAATVNRQSEDSFSVI